MRGGWEESSDGVTPRLELSILPSHLAPLPCCPICGCHHYPPVFQARMWTSPSTSFILLPATRPLCRPVCVHCLLPETIAPPLGSVLCPPSLPTISSLLVLTISCLPFLWSCNSPTSFALLLLEGCSWNIHFYSERSPPPPAHVAHKTQLDTRVFAQFMPTFFHTLTSIIRSLGQGHSSVPSRYLYCLIRVFISCKSVKSYHSPGWVATEHMHLYYVHLMYHT